MKVREINGKYAGTTFKITVRFEAHNFPQVIFVETLYFGVHLDALKGKFRDYANELLEEHGFNTHAYGNR